MVLSNKKLKQKLRAVLTQNQTNSNVVDGDADGDAPSSSFKQLLDSAAHTPMLSKREKRRKLRSLQHPSVEAAHEGEGEGEDEDESRNKENGKEDLANKKNKKRKTKRKVKDDDVANGVPKESKKKKQKKGSNHRGEMPEATGLTKTNTSISQESSDVSTKVYVGGIPYYSTEDDIRSYFEGCGTITEVDCMSFPDSGKFRGIAIISFKTEAAAKRALALDGADMGGLFLKIQPYNYKPTRFAPEILEGYNRVYVGNLSMDITEEELKKFFSNCNITSIRFGMDKETGEFRGYAHVDFSDSQSLKTALTLDQKVLFGRPVRVSCAVPLKKKNPPPAEEPSPTASASAHGKMKKRRCYGCGEKGHAVSECPKNQTVAATTT